ncbi:PREDICTED: protein takeout-like isoform X1 [Acromyrmex echinatior]|uniref:protein takeout-like isoform X1 n=1 Tax=Acromyrmex echinatior TaxID=103372 RepID=UPI00058105EB|nr:PREDICTED: protein takeout-like isoform X1 [Acromyrmex echinatior]
MLLYVLSIFSAIFALCSAGESEFSLRVTCKRNSDDYSACLKQTMEEIWSRVVTGLPEFDIPSVDPLSIKNYKFVMNSGNVHGELILLNSTITGLSKLRILNIRTYFLDDIFYLESDINIPRISSKGSVNINGNLNALRIANEGYYNLILEDVSGTTNFTGHVINDTWIVEHFYLVPSIGKFKLYYDDVIKEKKAITDVVVNFINENWLTIYPMVISSMFDRLELFFIDSANKFFSKVPFSKIFP